MRRRVRETSAVREREKEVLESKWVSSNIVSTAGVNFNEASLSSSEMESKRESKPQREIERPKFSL